MGFPKDSPQGRGEPQWGDPDFQETPHARRLKPEELKRLQQLEQEALQEDRIGTGEIPPQVETRKDLSETFETHNKKVEAAAERSWGFIKKAGGDIVQPTHDPDKYSENIKPRSANDLLSDINGRRGNINRLSRIFKKRR